MEAISKIIKKERLAVENGGTEELCLKPMPSLSNLYPRFWAR